MDPIKVKGIEDWPIPKSAKNIQQFLGFCNFYWKFINNFTEVAHPMNQLTWKTTNFEWNPKAEQSFQTLKHAFLERPILKMVDQSEPFELECDASMYALGAVLLQRDTNGDKHPVAYFSKALTPAQQNYHCSDQEFLAIIKAFKEWRHYLEGSPHPIVIWSDHENLTRWREPQQLN